MAFSSKRSYSRLQETKMRCPRDLLEDEYGPAKKRLKKNLVDIFNRASMCMTASEDHMNVFLRIKPFTVEESEDENQGCIKVNDAEQSVVAVAPEPSNAYKNLKRALGKSEHKFTFSRIFNENTSQSVFFNETMLGMTKQFISGQNSLVFTYGVTSSGKTYTIQGEPQDEGILPRSLDVLFNSISGRQIKGIKLKPQRFNDVVQLRPEEELAEKKLKDKTLKMITDEETFMANETDILSCTIASCSSTSHDETLPNITTPALEKLKVDVGENDKFNFCVWVSFAEIYNEQLFDLLERIPSKKNCKRSTLKIAEDQNGSPYVKGLKEIPVDSADEAYRLLTIGQKNLHRASTRLNHCSSRSHCIFTIKIIRVVDKEDPNIATVSMLSFCDLAGSERYSKTQATGDLLKEASNINTSLLTLGRCIEILRFNQVHRDSQKIVPFRDSKLTRLFQNFFNGSGRAAMIVNVSQCASMFDETLHVFKFSAIAKQVKYLQKPVEPLKTKRTKTLPCLPRPSIPWEDPGSLETLPTDNDDSEEDSNMDGDGLESDSEDVDVILANRSSEELIQTIKTLMEKNSKLHAMLEEEIVNSSNLEIRVRREVYEAMKKQQVLIDKEYSKLLEETSEDARETADERVQNVIDLYEKRLKEIQRKVDDDDEWVSSLVFFREEQKVQERDKRIAELEKLLKEKESGDSQSKEKDEKMELLEEYIIELKSLQHCKEKEQEEKVEELESYIKECGDVYERNMAQIAQLQQEAAAFVIEKDEAISKVEKAENKAEGAGNKIAELQTLLNDMEKKMQSKDDTMKTLEEECQQMQGEIERLQDQMSQIDDMSKRSDPESSINVDDRSGLNHCDIFVQTDLLDIKEFDLLQERCSELQTVTQTVLSEKLSLEEKLKALCDENENLKERIQRLDERECEMKCSKDENENLKTEIMTLQHDGKQQTFKLNEMECEMKHLKDENENLNAEILTLQQDGKEQALKLDEMKHLKEENENLNAEILTLQQDGKEQALKLDEMKHLKEENENFNAEILTLQQDGKQQTLILDEMEDKMKNLKDENENLNAEILTLQQDGKTQALRQQCLLQTPQSTMITDMVIKLENKSTPGLESIRNESLITDSDDEIVFNPNSVPATGELSGSVITSSNQIKDAELTIKALRNKLKREEEDFFKREQALIHGYTAEIDHLKVELFKLKSKSQSNGQSEIKKNVSASSFTLVEKIEESVSSCVKDEGPVYVLESEVASLQEQLLSSREAFRQLQDKVKDVDSNAESASDKRWSIPSLVSKNNITDSVLQFEMTEYVVELDMWKNRVEEKQKEIEHCKKMLQESQCGNKDLKEKLNLLVSDNESLLNELEEGKSKIDVFKSEVEGLRLMVKENQSLVNEREIAREGISAKLDTALQAKTELKNKVDQLTLDMGDLIDKILTKDNVIEENNLELISMQNIILDLKKEQESLERAIIDLKKEAEVSNVKIEDHLNNKSKEQCLLENAQKDLKEVHDTNAQLQMKNEMIEEESKQLKDKLNLLSTQVEEHKKVISIKDQELQELKHQYDEVTEALKKAKDSLETIKQDQQQESAEVSQKLVLLEKEKRFAERKLNEMKGKEQAHEKLAEFDHELQNQLRSIKEALKKQSSKTSELTNELNVQLKEISELRIERDVLKSEVENLQLHSNRMEEECGRLRQKGDKARKRTEELMDDVNELKTGLRVSDEITEQQERIITQQDERIGSLKSKLDTMESEKDQLEKMSLQNGKEISTLCGKEDELKKLISEKEKEISIICQQQDELKKLNMKKENEISTMHEQQNELNKVISEKDNEITTLCEKQNDLKELVSEKEKLISTLCEKHDHMKELISEREKEISTVHKKQNTELLQHDELKFSNERLKKEISEYMDQLKAKDQIQQDTKLQLETTQQDLKRLEKDLMKQMSINRRNKEEMEDWKKEKDLCLTNFKEALERMLQEKNDLSQENANLKKDNSDLVKQVTNSRVCKDKVIADLRKNNNTLSIELASVQGISPPPKMDTPDRGYPNHIELTDDVDTTGHLQMDATPPVALKKGRKRQSCRRKVSTSLTDDDNLAPKVKSLKVIEETNEESPCSSGFSNKLLSSVSDLSDDVTSSGKRGKARRKPTSVSSIMIPDQVQNENVSPVARRLRSKPSDKRSII